MTALSTKNPAGASQPSGAAAPRRLRVLVFTTVFPNERQPLHGTFVFERVRQLATLVDMQVVAPVPWFRAFHELPPREQTTDILAVYNPRFWYLPKVLKTFRGVFLFVSTVRLIGRLRKRFDFDLIDAHFAYPDGFAAVLLGRWFRRPVSITLRGTIIPLSRRPTGRLLCDWAIRRAERVIAVAEILAERARHGGVAPRRIATIANGIDATRFQLRDSATARLELGLPEGKRLVVSVGHLSPRKGFHRIIRALPRIIQCCPDVHLAIIGGKGAEEDNTVQLHALVQRLRLSDRVLFVGPQQPDQVALWLAAADAFVLASDFEGCPNVVLEAMSCGRPVVATKVGDIARMVPAFGGILFDDPEDEGELARSVIAALAREWDAPLIRDHIAAQSWASVAQRVLAQWHLAIESFAARTTVDAPILSRNPLDTSARSREI